MKLISGPAIAALRLRSRMTENMAMRGGVYGPSVMIDRVRFVRLDEVERVTGQHFTAEQLAAAGGPGRLIEMGEVENGIAA
jgi:hypothetical protein